MCLAGTPADEAGTRAIYQILGEKSRP